MDIKRLSVLHSLQFLDIVEPDTFSFVKPTYNNCHLWLRADNVNTKSMRQFINGVEKAQQMDLIGEHAVLQEDGSVEYDEVTKKFGNASFKFDGSSNEIIVEQTQHMNITLDLVNDWTIDLWIYHNTLTGTQSYITKRIDANNRWVLQANGSSIEFKLIDGGSTVINLSSAGLVTTTWQHVVMVKKADEYALYLDGTQIAYVQTTSVKSIDSKLYVGSNDASDYLDGNVDELRVFSSNLFDAAPVVGLSDTIIVPTEKSDNLQVSPNNQICTKKDADNVTSIGQIINSEHVSSVASWESNTNTRPAGQVVSGLTLNKGITNSNNPILVTCTFTGKYTGTNYTSNSATCELVAVDSKSNVIYLNRNMEINCNRNLNTSYNIQELVTLPVENYDFELRVFTGTGDAKVFFEQRALTVSEFRIFG